jgi:hypothetical protein
LTTHEACVLASAGLLPGQPQPPVLSLPAVIGTLQHGSLVPAEDDEHATALTSDAATTSLANPATLALHRREASDMTLPVNS